jgi:uncharacterized SAM-binding protein YcdF (DUF218 family)
VNQLFVLLGVESWKAIVAGLLLPPVPWLLTTLIGARLLSWRRWAGWLVLVASMLLLWLSACSGVGDFLQSHLLHPPPTLSAERIAALKRESASSKSVAIVALGGGRRIFVPEYGLSGLQSRSLERLRYAIWLSRETGSPVAFSGGTGYAQPQGSSEAQVAARIAAREFGRPLRWTEEQSRDTRENAAYTVPLLHAAGVTRIVLVTHAYHMPRAQRAFEEAIRHAGASIAIEPAPIDTVGPEVRPVLRWMPSNEGFDLTRNVLREVVGLLAGA